MRWTNRLWRDGRSVRPFVQVKEFYLYKETRARVPAPHVLVVVLQPQMRDQFFALQMAQGVLQLHQLNEQIVLGIQARRSHWRLEVEAQPFLDAETAQLWS